MKRGGASNGMFWMTFFKDKVSAVAAFPPSPHPPQVSFRVPWLGYIGIRPWPRGQRPSLFIILSFAHRTFRSVLVISSSNCFAINLSTTKRSFDTAFKLKVVKAAKDHSKHYAAKLFNVNRRRVQEWCAQKEKLQSNTK